MSNAGSWTSAIAWLDSTGGIKRLVQLPTESLFYISFADDGTLWALALEKDASRKASLGDDMLRHYDKDGILLGTALPRGTFPQKQFRVKDTLSSPDPVSMASSLVVAGDRIGLYADNAHEWVEISATSGVLEGRWVVPDASFDRGGAWFTMTASGNVYISYQTRPVNGVRQHGVYQFDKTSGTLQSVEISQVLAQEPGSKVVHVLGADGDNLVVSTTWMNPKLMWTEPVK